MCTESLRLDPAHSQGSAPCSWALWVRWQQNVSPGFERGDLLQCVSVIMVSNHFCCPGPGPCRVGLSLLAPVGVGWGRGGGDSDCGLPGELAKTQRAGTQAGHAIVCVGGAVRQGDRQGALGFRIPGLLQLRCFPRGDLRQAMLPLGLSLPICKTGTITGLPSLSLGDSSGTSRGSLSDHSSDHLVADSRSSGWGLAWICRP